MSLKTKTISGVVWSFSHQFSVQVITLIIQLFLARLLAPADFGLIAMIQIFIAIGKTLMDSGMTSSLIRNQENSQKDYSTVFFMNVVMSILIYITICLCAPLISSFYEEPILIPLIRIFTVTFILQSLASIQVTKLTKELNFKMQLYIQLPSTIIGGIVGLLMGYNGYGVWSIVWMNIVAKSFFLIQIWYKSNWKPDLVFDYTCFKKHFNFGYKLTLSGLITNIYLNVYRIIIGKMFSTTQLGFYNQADNLRMFPVSNITATLQKVTYPMFSIVQNEDERLKNIFLKITALVFYVVCPTMVILTLIAEPLFITLLTSKWLESVPYFQILALSSVVYPLSIYNLNIILVKGRTDLHLKMEVLKKVLSLLFLFLIIPFGIWGVILAQAISMFIHFFVNAFYCGKLINFPLHNQLLSLSKIILVNLIIAVAMYYLTFIMDGFVNASNIKKILTMSISYLAAYLIISKIWDFKELDDLVGLIKRVLKIDNNNNL